MIRFFTRAALCLVAAVLTASCSDDIVGGGGPEPEAGPTQNIAAGTQHVCTLGTGGEVYCWGRNAYGAVGIAQASMEACTDAAPAGPLNSCSRVPRRVGGSTLRLRFITAGEQSTCGITPQGEAVCWGAESFAMFGGMPAPTCGPSYAAARCSFAPVTLPFPQRWKQLSLASGFPTPHMCGVTEAGEGFCWGAGGGRLGSGSSKTAASSTPQPVVGGYRFSKIAAGVGHSCGLTVDGVAYCWGHNADGELGTSAPMESCVAFSGGRTPVEYNFPCTGTPQAVQGGYRFTDIAAGTGISCGVTAAGEVLCWGFVLRLEGSAGSGPYEEAARPRPIFPGVVARKVHIPAGGRFAFVCALGTEDSVSCRGDNNRGQLGNGKATPYIDPAGTTRVAGGARYASLALTENGGCATVAGGGVSCWGDNTSYALARTGVAFDPTPAPVVMPAR